MNMPYGDSIEVGVVQMERAMVWSIAFMASLLAGSQAQAQQIDQARRGLSLAKFACAQCHSVQKRSRRSPDAAAPRFEDIANSGMTAAAISVALQTTPHRRMPNVRLNRDDLNDLVTYILSLKRAER
jgi:mono/diheme cytochrome c family protein